MLKSLLPHAARAFVPALCWALASTASAQQAPTDADRAQARAILETSVEMDTSLDGNRNPELANYFAQQFRAAGFPAADIHILPLDNTAALVVRWRGDGTGGRPVLLMGHMDVVTARRADWERDPFTMVEENGYFYGRGVYDNKSGLAALTATILQMRAEGFTPTRDLIVAFTGDEETTGATARMLVSQHRDLIDSEFALNTDAGKGILDETTGEPVQYYYETSEKTYASFTLTAHNEGGHSSLPRPDNAIFDLADAIQAVRAFEFPLMWNDTTLASLAAGGAVRRDALGRAMARFANHPGDRRAARTLAADGSTAGQIRTTCVPTLLSGGHADNALPQSAVVTVNCRIFPGIAIADVQADLQRLVGDKIAVALLADFYMASDASPLRQDVTDAVTAAIGAAYPGTPIAPRMAPGATDGLFFRAVGIPTYGVSEMFLKESEDFSHGLNERIPVESLYKGLIFYRALLTSVAGRR